MSNACDCSSRKNNSRPGDSAAPFAPKTRFGVWFRNRVASLLSFRPIAYHFVERDLRDDFELPRYET